MSNTEKFLDKYKLLEAALKQKYGDSMTVSRLESTKEFFYCSRRIKQTRELRNLLSHNAKIDGEWPCEVSGNLIEFLDSLISRVLDPPRLCDVALPIERVLTATLDSRVSSVMAEMHRRDISKVPVLDERGVVIGMFSHQSVFDNICSNGGEHIYEKRFSEIEHLIRIDGENELCYPYAKWTDTCESAERLVESITAQHKRARLILLTENGKKNERLLGALTAWELLQTDK